MDSTFPLFLCFFLWAHVCCAQSLKGLNNPACDQYKTCQECAEADKCGWCESSKTCIEGTFKGPEDLSSCTNYDWRCDTCTQYQSCETCTQQNWCYWCLETNSCLSAEESTFGYDDFTCKGALYSCDDPCLGPKRCADCVIKEGCGWCNSVNACFLGNFDNPDEQYCDRSWRFDCEHTCNTRNTCEDCVHDGDCTWCTETNKCIFKGPLQNPYIDHVDEEYYEELRDECSNLAEEINECPLSTNCNEYTSCDSCTLNYRCGWCDDTGRCADGDDNEPTFGSQCQGWVYFNDQCFARGSICDQVACPSNSQKTPGVECTKDIDDCVCDESFEMNRDTHRCQYCELYACPANSTRKPGSQCVKGFSDCDCDKGFKKNKREEMCDPCSTYQCPENSIPKESVNCIRRFRDCECEYGFERKDGECELCSSFECPGNSYTVIECVKSFRDCKCVLGYEKNNNEGICESCDTYECPDGSHRKDDVRCVHNFDECECDSGRVRGLDSCVDCFRFVGRGICRTDKIFYRNNRYQIVDSEVTLEKCKQLCLDDRNCQGINLEAILHGKGTCHLHRESPRYVNPGGLIREAKCYAFTCTAHT